MHKAVLLTGLLLLAIGLSGCVEEQLIGGETDEHGCLPSAGYTWCEAKQKCLRTWEEDGAPTELKFFRKLGLKRKNYSQLIILAKVLAHDINQGYQNMTDLIVTHVNGKSIGSLQDLVDAFRLPVPSYHTVRTYTGEVIVLMQRR